MEDKGLREQGLEVVGPNRKEGGRREYLYIQVE